VETFTAPLEIEAMVDLQRSNDSSVAGVSQEAQLARTRNGSGAIAYAQPLEDSVQMPFGGSNGDGHLSRDLGVRKTARDMLQDGRLRSGQHSARRAIELSSRHEPSDGPRAGPSSRADVCRIA
jgi:hypothetical protein